MNSTMSSTWVQLASLLSRTPSEAEIDSPLAQTPGNPASSAIRALRPLWASMRKLRDGPWNSPFKRVVLRDEVACTGRASWVFTRRGISTRASSNVRQIYTSPTGTPGTYREYQRMKRVPSAVLALFDRDG